MSTVTSDDVQFIKECLQTASKEDLLTIATSLVVEGIEAESISINTDVPASLEGIYCAHSGDTFKEFIEGT